MRNEELVTLVKVFENIGEDKEKVIILGTQIDALNYPLKDWEKQKQEWHKYLEDLYKNDSLIEKNVIGVSARINSLVCRLPSLDDLEVREIINFAEKCGIEIIPKGDGFLGQLSKLFSKERNEISKKEKEILTFTHIHDLIERLKHGPLSNPMKILSDDMNFRYKLIIEQLKEKSTFLKKDVEEVYDALSRDISKREQIINSKKEKISLLDNSLKSIHSGFSEIKKNAQLTLNESKKEIISQLTDV